MNVTEGSCYLPWIAESYGMELGKGFASGCRSASGDLSDRNKSSCWAINSDMCNFGGVVFNNTVDGISFVVDATATGILFDRCLFVGQGLTQIEMTYVCLIAGGTALLAVSAAGAATATSSLVPLLAWGFLV